MRLNDWWPDDDPPTPDKELLRAPAGNLEERAARAVLQNAELRSDLARTRDELEHVTYHALLLTALCAILLVLAVAGWLT